MSNYRKITDVEVVEQMTENDTILIEQNGEIKRTKGVVGGGGGEKYIIEATQDADGNMIFSWRTPVAFDVLANAIKNGEMPDITVVIMYEGIVAGTMIVGRLMFADPTLSQIVIDAWDNQITFSNDGSLTVI